MTISNSRNLINPIRYKFAIVIFLTGLVGCGQTQISPENRELLLKLATATSIEDLHSISTMEKEIKERSVTGAMNQNEYDALQTVITLARQNSWEQARIKAYALRDGQEPTKEDIERVNQRILPEITKISRRK